MDSAIWVGGRRWGFSKPFWPKVDCRQSKNPFLATTYLKVDCRRLATVGAILSSRLTVDSCGRRGPLKVDSFR
eukprot:1196203-Prorocentrum_minimum.AAC.11